MIVEKIERKRIKRSQFFFLQNFIMNFPIRFPAINPMPIPQTTDIDEKDEVEKKTEELIIMTGGKGPRRWRQRKKEYIKKLEQDNAQLKNMIVDLQQRISAFQAQKDIYRDQLSYFQGCLAQAAPFVFQPQQKQNNNSSVSSNSTVSSSISSTNSIRS